MTILVAQDRHFIRPVQPTGISNTNAPQIQDEICPSQLGLFWKKRRDINTPSWKPKSSAKRKSNRNCLLFDCLFWPEIYSDLYKGVLSAFDKKKGLERFPIRGLIFSTWTSACCRTLLPFPWKIRIPSFDLANRQFKSTDFSHVQRERIKFVFVGFILKGKYLDNRTESVESLGNVDIDKREQVNKILHLIVKIYYF